MTGAALFLSFAARILRRGAGGFPLAPEIPVDRRTPDLHFTLKGMRLR